MEAIRLRKVAKGSSLPGLLALGMLFAMSGCDTTSEFVAPGLPVADNVPCRVVGIWSRGIATAADSLHNGAPLMGIAGRVLLYNEAGLPVACDGDLVVCLYDDTPRPGVTGPVEVHEWVLDHETLKRLQRTDMFGQGYSVFLPWPEDKPLFSQMQLKLRYYRANQPTLFGESGPMNIEGPEVANQPVQARASFKPPMH
jgi:hypothetical protein